MDKSPVDRLEAAGLCNSADLSENDKKALSSLSDTEVKVLIDLHQRLGKAEGDAARPAFPL